jgi:sulfur relay (sulfurtransferase) complex TusBCD TusD component (DsrE family)
MSIIIIIDAPPYGDERPYNGLRLAQALLDAGEWIELFLLGDGVHVAHARQDPRGAHASLEPMLAELVGKGAVVTLCGTCCQARGLGEDELVEGVRIGTIHDLADLVRRSDKVLTF